MRYVHTNYLFFFFNDTATTEIYTLSLHDALPISVIMVGRGDAEHNKKKASEHGIRFPVVLQERWKLSREYGIFATPVAFLIGKDGVLMRNVAKGPDQIMALAHAALALEERGRRPGEENVTIRKTPLLSG